MKEWLLEKSYRIPLCLTLWVLCLYGFGLGNLEFLRHTEADRTLISWEMLEHGRLLVPTLLHSEILTKPPLYYWCTAFWLWLFGTDSVAVARLTSLFAALFGVLFQYYVWLVISSNKGLAGVFALALSTSILYFNLGTVAEIDMLFGALTLASLSSLFLVMEVTSVPKKISISLLGVSTALAFLTKGPPVIFFLIGSYGLYSVWQILSGSLSDFWIFLKRTFFPISLSALLAIFLILCWLVPLGTEVGWKVLGDRLEEEVFLRVLSFSERGRGFHFYIGALFSNAMPWSLFAAIGLFRFFFSDAKEGESWTSKVSPVLEQNDTVRKFFQYSLCVLLAGFIMLSMAQGKSSRYAFPLLPFLLNIWVLFSFQCLQIPVFKKLVKFIRVIFCFVFIASLLAVVFVSLEGVSNISFYCCITLLSLTSIAIVFSKTKTMWKHWIIYLVIVLCVVRSAQALIYAPHRNATRSVKMLAENIVLELQGRPIYTVELFERWTVYYAKRLGAPAYRLTPDFLNKFTDPNESQRLLFAVEEEGWRFFQLQQYDASTSLKRVFPHSTSASYIVDTSTEVLPKLGLFSIFPTVPSVPFYPELEQRDLIGK